MEREENKERKESGGGGEEGKSSPFDAEGAVHSERQLEEQGKTE